MTPISRRTFLRSSATIAFAYSLAVPQAAYGHTRAPHHGGYPDALTHYALDCIRTFERWLSGRHGYVGEVSFPQNLTTYSRFRFYDEQRWAALGERWYDYADAQRFWVTAHGVSERFYNLHDGGYATSIWLCPGKEKIPSTPRPKVISRPGYQAALLKRHRGPYRGVNFSNAQAWDRGVHSSANPGLYGTDYWYPTISDYPTDPNVNGGKNSYEYLYSEGVRLIRLGFRWERIQPRLGDALNTTELGRMKQSVRNAGRAGLKVILDLHNPGGYWKGTSGGGGRPRQGTA